MSSNNDFSIFDKISKELKNKIIKFNVYSNGENMIFITNDNKVYAIGSNTWGDCGLGHNREVNEPQEIQELNNKNIQRFIFGFDFVMGLTLNGQLYGWGCNYHGQLGRDTWSEYSHFLRPEVITTFKDIRISQLSCGYGHTLALTSDGKVYGWGINSKGQVGCGRRKGKEILKPKLIKYSEPIKAVYCHWDSSIALTTDGKAYSWGLNDFYQLGHEVDNNENIFEPKLIDISDVMSVCLKDENMYLLTNEENIYFCGKYNSELKQKIPKAIKTDFKPKSLYSYKSIASTVSTEGTVYELIEDTINITNFPTIFDLYRKKCGITLQMSQI